MNGLRNESVASCLYITLPMEQKEVLSVLFVLFFTVFPFVMGTADLGC